jgi:hypothetical protein
MTELPKYEHIEIVALDRGYVVSDGSEDVAAFSKLPELIDWLRDNIVVRHPPHSSAGVWMGVDGPEAGYRVIGYPWGGGPTK